jgi:hypothetical protein
MNAQPMQSVGTILSRTVRFYARHVRLVMIVTFPVVAFVELVVALGLGELTASSHKRIPTGDVYIDLAASVLITTPLVTAMLARAVVGDLHGDERPRARDLVLDGLDLFAPAFFAQLLFAAGVVAGFVALLFPGIYLAVSWYFVVQSVVIDRVRGFATVGASAALVRGRWWHTAGVLLSLELVVALPSLAAGAGLGALSVAANSDAVMVLGNILIGTFGLPFVAIGATLYYLELRDRAGMPAPRPQPLV